MIDPVYGVKCLKLGFDRYIRYSKIGASIRCSKTSVSFYVDKKDGTKPTNARASNHHPSLQNYTKGGKEPWLSDNISVEFIVPNSNEDKKPFRARVKQNINGIIQPFDVTTYQYDSDLIEPTDIIELFKAIVIFLNGGGYSDPFAGTPKSAKIIHRTANIKPRQASNPTTNEGVIHNLPRINETELNKITYLCLGDIIIENKLNTMKKRIRLTESQLHNVIRRCINEAYVDDYDMKANAWNNIAGGVISYVDMRNLLMDLSDAGFRSASSLLYEIEDRIEN